MNKLHDLLVAEQKQHFLNLGYTERNVVTYPAIHYKADAVFEDDNEIVLVEALGLRDGDYITVRKSNWTNMLNWEETQRTWNMLPSETKKRIKAKGVKGP